MKLLPEFGWKILCTIQNRSGNLGCIVMERYRHSAIGINAGNRGVIIPVIVEWIIVRLGTGGKTQAGQKERPDKV